VIVLCITLLPGGKDDVEVGSLPSYCGLHYDQSPESILCARRRRNRALKLREQKDAKRRGRLFASFLLIKKVSDLILFSKPFNPK